MKRDWDMIRDILIRLEEKSSDDNPLGLQNFEEDEKLSASYHVELLDEAGIIHATISKTHGRGPTAFFARRMTWHGHELLDSIRSDTVWNKTKQTFISKGLSMTFDLVKSVAIGVSKELIKTQTGIG